MTQGHRQIGTDLVTSWKQRAACSGYPNELFFPLPEAPPRVVEKAKAVCSICTVNEDCLQYAFETNQRAGIWGGTSENERKSLRRKWLAARRRGG